MKNALETICGLAVLLATYAVIAVIGFYPWLKSLIHNAKAENYFSIIVWDLMFSPIGWLHGVYLIFCGGA